MRMKNKERNRQVKLALSKEFGKDATVSVTGGRGTATGWCDIVITVTDPCPDKQNELPCSKYCANGICKGNNRPLRGGWVNSVRQIANIELSQKATDCLVEEKIVFDTSSSYGGRDAENKIIAIRFV